MTAEDGLLSSIAANPECVTTKLVYADWLKENDRPEEEQAWRWIVAFRRKPCPFRLFRIDQNPYWTGAPVSWLRPEDRCAGYGWVNWFSSRLLEWPDTASDATIPQALFRYFPRGNAFDTTWNGDRCYDDRKQAYLVLVDAFVRATRPRTNWLDRVWAGKGWQPDWVAASRVPTEYL